MILLKIETLALFLAIASMASCSAEPRMRGSDAADRLSQTRRRAQSGDACLESNLPETTLFYENFEHDGYGDFCVPSSSSGLVVATSDRGGYCGSTYAVRMRETSTMHSQPINITGYRIASSLSVSFGFMPRGMNDGDSFTVQAAFAKTMQDGICGETSIDDWDWEKTWTRGVDWDVNGNWYDASAEIKYIPSYASARGFRIGENSPESNPPNWMRIGIQMNGTGYYDKVFFDEIRIRGTAK